MQTTKKTNASINEIDKQPKNSKKLNMYVKDSTTSLSPIIVLGLESVIPFLFQLDTLDLLKQSSRLVHYCATPLLFSPAWRHFVMSDMPETASSHSPNHSSGGMVAEEAWHMDLRSSFLQQYVQFLQKLGLTPIETKVSSPRQT